MRPFIYDPPDSLSAPLDGGSSPRAGLFVSPVPTRGILAGGTTLIDFWKIDVNEPEVVVRYQCTRPPALAKRSDTRWMAPRGFGPPGEDAEHLNIQNQTTPSCGNSQTLRPVRDSQLASLGNVCNDAMPVLRDVSYHCMQ